MQVGSAAMQVGLGVDLGTSGVRASVVEIRPGESVRILGEASSRWTDAEGRSPGVWLSALRETLAACEGVSRVTRVCVSGTSASVLAVDSSGRVCRAPAMYGDAVAGAAGAQAMATIAARAPAGHTTRAATSSLAKLLAWHFEAAVGSEETIVHQADYVATALACGVSDFAGEEVRLLDASDLRSDWHNSLKLGFDVEALRWPSWIVDGALADCALPASVLERLNVLRPGLGTLQQQQDGTAAQQGGARTVSSVAAEQWGLPLGAEIVGGTTDSIAAFLACSASADGALPLTPGTAVTSLGSTTALKLVSRVKVDDSQRGVYSHRLDDASGAAWLVGGASNVGCKVLRAEGYDDPELADLSERLTVRVRHANDEGVYPLVTVGERFPVNDPAKQPRMPETTDRTERLASLLTGIADVERLGYKALDDLGATPLESVKTAGGGAKNEKWRLIRERMLQVPVGKADHVEASFGAALLALRHV